MRRLGGRSRCVNDQGTKGEDTALFDEALALGLGSSQLVDGAGRESAKAMRALYDSNGTVRRRARVEVNANGEHPLKDINGRLHVRHPSLFGPRPKSWHVDALARGDREILMPHDFPIRGWCFVEEQRADSEALVTEHRGRKGPNIRRDGERSNVLVQKQVSRTAAPIYCVWCYDFA